MTLATLETRSFSFVALGVDDEHALRVMRVAWEKHRELTGARMEWAEVEDSVGLDPVALGECLRDHTVIVKGVR